MSVEKVLRVVEQKEPINRYERTESSGTWRLRDNIIYWENTISTWKFDVILHDWVKTSTETTELSPENSPQKLAKELIADIVLVRERDSDEQASGKLVLTYLRKLKVKVKDDFPNVWLCREGGKIFIKDLLRTVTYSFNCCADELVTIEKISEKKVTMDELKTLDTQYIFNKFEGEGENQLYGKWVNPANIG